MHGCAIGKRPTGLVHHPSHAVKELHHDPARSEAGAVGSAGLCGTGAFKGSSRPAGHIWANVFSLVRRSSQSSCVLSNWDTPKASPIALPRGSTVSGLQSAPMRGRLRLWSIVRWRPGTGSRQAAAPVRTRRSQAMRMLARRRRTRGKRTAPGRRFSGDQRRRRRRIFSSGEQVISGGNPAVKKPS